MKSITLKKIAASALTFALFTSFTACSGAAEATPAVTNDTEAPASEEETEAQSEENTVLRVGASITPHSEILEIAAPILAEQGITLEIVPIEDSITPNTGVSTFPTLTSLTSRTVPIWYQ